MKSWWVYIGLSASIVVILYLLFKKPGIPDSSSLISKNDSLKKILVLHDVIDNARIKAITMHDSLSKRSLDSALNIIAQDKISLKSAKTALALTVASLGDAIDATKDTSLIHKFDSVNNELSKAYVLVGDYSKNNDSTIVLLGRELTYKDSVIATMNSEIKDLKVSLTSSTLNFDALNKDNQTLEKQIKKQNLFTKIGTALGLVVGIFLGHNLK